MTTWQPGMKLTAGRLNAAPGLLVAKFESDTAQSIPPNADTPIVFTRLLLDLTTAFDPANPTRFRPLLAGWYVFGGGVSFEGAAGTQVQSLLRLNGSANVSGSHGTDSTADNPSVPFKTTAEYLNGVDDYVELMGRHNAAAAVNTATTLARRPLLTVTYAGP